MSALDATLRMLVTVPRLLVALNFDNLLVPLVRCVQRPSLADCGDRG